MTKSKVLPINMKPETRLSFHLSTVLSEDRYPWFYEHFINIKVWGESKVYMDFVDNIIDESYRALYSERVCYTSKMIPNEEQLIHILTDIIDRKFYSYLWLDKFEIPDTVEYHNYHFVHPVLVYGYDDAERVLYILNFTWSKGSYLQKVSYEDIKKAFLLMNEQIENNFHMMGGDTVLISYKVNQNIGKQQFNIKCYLNELGNYIFSRSDSIAENYPDHYVTCEYGLNGYKKLLYVCDHVSDGLEIAFKSLFDLNLHKQYMYERLCYILDKYDISFKTAEHIKKYSRVVQIFETIQTLNMKYQTYAKKIAASFCTEPRFIDKLKRLLLEAWQIEKDNLLPIYMELSYGVELKNTPMSFPQMICKEYRYNSEEKASVSVEMEDPVMAQRVEILDISNSPQWRPMGVLRINDEQEYLIEDNRGIGHKNRGIDIIPCKICKLEYTEVVPTLADIRELKFRICGLYDSICWDFTKHESYTWLAEKDIDDIRYDEGITYIINGNDANLSCKNVNIPAERGKYIYVKYRNRTNSEVAQIFFNTYTDTILSEEMSKVITIGSGEDSIEYVFDMTDNTVWDGIIKDLRFDPTGYDNTTEDGECMIEYIKMNDTAPVYDSRKHFCGSQGVNGWFYYAYNNGTTYREMQYDKEKGVWEYPMCPELFIMNESQNSYHHMATVRRYVCQAEGTYTVKYSVSLETPNEKSYLTIKRNHRIVEKYRLCKFNGEDTLKIELEYGENLNFEYYNEDENTTEAIRLNITIEKVEK